VVSLFSASSSSSNCYDVVLDSSTAATRVYWTDNGLGTVSAATAGVANSSVVLVNEPSALAVALDATNVYWTASPSGAGYVRYAPIPTTLGAIPIGSITTAVSASNPSGSFNDLGVDSANIYWVVRGTSVSSINAIPLAGGPAVTLAAQGGTDNHLVLPAGSPSIYWTLSPGLFSTYR
jgi:hypothetical protein